MLRETDVTIINKREDSTNKTVIQYASVHEERIYAAITFFFFFFYLGCILQSFIWHWTQTSIESGY